LSGAFILLRTHEKKLFLDYSVLGVEMRDLFQVQTMDLSVAVWVVFLGRFGVTTDYGVIQSTYAILSAEGMLKGGASAETATRAARDFIGGEAPNPFRVCARSRGVVGL